MPNLDLANNYSVESIFHGTIGSDGTTFSSSFNISTSEGGFLVVAFLIEFQDGVYDLTLQESPDDSVWTDIPVDILNDPGGLGRITLNSQGVPGEDQPGLGAFSTDTFIRVKISANAITFGSALSANAVLRPTPNPQS